jgi:hypothetical protein
VWCIGKEWKNTDRKHHYSGKLSCCCHITFNEGCQICHQCFIHFGDRRERGREREIEIERARDRKRRRERGERGERGEREEREEREKREKERETRERIGRRRERRERRERLFILLLRAGQYSIDYSMQLHLATLVFNGGNCFLSDWGPLRILNWRFVKSVAVHCCTEGKEAIVEAAGF